MKFNKKWLAPIAISLLLVGCSDKGEADNSEISDEQSYTVVDDRGIELKFDEVPETIVSLKPSNTEILFELGVGDKIIGGTDYDTYPEEAKKIERVSDSNTVNTEKVIEMNPDVVIAYYDFGDMAQIEQMESAGLKVFVINAASKIDDVYGDIEQIAQIMKVEEKGKEVVSDIKAEIEEVKEKTAKIEQKRKVYFEIAPAPDIWSIGAGTFQQELIEAAGVDNIYVDQEGWFAVTEEDIITRNPEAIITTVVYSDDPIGEILSRTGWESISAIKNKEVFVLNSDIMDRPGPRIGEAIELIASTIYPDLFK